MSADLYVLNTKSTIPDKNIITRQKFGTQAKKCLAYFRDTRTKIHKIQQTIPELIKILKDFRKSIDIICIYEALGLLTRISPTKYIYSGYRGVSAKLMDYESGKMDGVFVPVYDEIIYEGKTTSIKSSMIIGNIVALLFFEVIYSSKTTNKSRIQTTIQQLASKHKEVNTKNLSQDAQNILVALNFIEKNQTTQIISFIGPEFYTYDEKQRKDELKIKDLMKKQQAYFTNNQSIVTHVHQQQRINEKQQPKAMNIQNFHPLSFAIFKSKHWQFPITSLSTIIGREGFNNNWHVDLNLPYRGVSRQHAVLLYNFKAKKWQIRCLSKKNLIKVDGERFAFRDRDIFLKNRSVIEIGPQNFLFCLAETQQSQVNN